MILGKCETVKRAKAWMKSWAVKETTGFVVFFNSKPCEWSRDLPETHKNRPGCIAVDILTGERYEARGGSYEAGHAGWETIERASDANAALDHLIANAGQPLPEDMAALEKLGNPFMSA